ncbi:MAG: cytochrome c-type biogenesis protein CcmH [Gemmatimonadota bacterium]|nr:MAG: cytochrome c-type biogenesis protein CcmH [Gemmatimonadota bacterium]
MISVKKIAVQHVLLVVALIAAVALAVQEGWGAQEESPAVTTEQVDPALEEQVREIAANLRCPTCRALSVLDSPSGMAQEMRGLIRDQLLSGKTPDEVTAYFVERYGEWILLQPKAEGFNWTVWLLPVLLLAGGLVFVLMTARRWVQQGQARAAEEGQEGEI